jgi:hypothetical protein
MVHSKIFLPHTFRNKIVNDKGLATGSGMRGLGLLLLDGGKGHFNSYPNYETYLATTNNTTSMGRGLDKTLTNKLEHLQLKPMGRKLKNIQFHM